MRDKKISQAGARSRSARKVRSKSARKVQDEKRAKPLAERIIRIRHFGAGQLVRVTSGYELRIFRNKAEAQALGVDPRIADAMPRAGGPGGACWNDWNSDGSFKCGGGCDAGCGYWVCELTDSGFTWVKKSGARGTKADAEKGALCGCNDQTT